LRDLIGKQEQEKLTADAQHFQKLNKAESERRIRMAKLTAPMFTSMAKYESIPKPLDARLATLHLADLTFLIDFCWSRRCGTKQINLLML
jgi:hypothetical protein